MSLLPAGKGVNVARGLARLGGRAVATGFVGRGERAAYEQSLAEDGVRADFQVVAEPTRVNTTIVDPVERTTTHLREQGFTVGPADLEALAARVAALVRAEASAPPVVFAGSLPPGVSPGAFARLLERTRAAGAPVVVDTNGPALRAAVESGAVTTFKPNVEELGEYLGREVDVAAAPHEARELLERVETVLLTHAEAGAWVVRADGTTHGRCRLKPGELANTVGCGDAFLAGWMCATAGRGTADVRDALSWALATAAASAMSESTVGYRRADVERIRPRVEIDG
jgi:1-phosphofructokinase family hexose kinase